MTRDLKYDGNIDPIECISRLDTEMEVYQVKELIRKKMVKHFATEFWSSVAYAPLVNTLANIKQKDDKTVRKYFKRFNDEVLKIQNASDETLKNFLIVGVRLSDRNSKGVNLRP